MALLKLKRGLSSNITSINLEQGEPAFTTDTKKLYIGDGDGGKTIINPDGGSAATAGKLTTSRNFSISGDGTAPAVSFDGTAAANLVLTLKNSGVTAGTYTKLTVDAKGLVTSAATLSASDIPSLTLSKVSDVGTAASKNTGTAAGNVPLLDSTGKLSESLLPPLAITEIFEAASQIEMLALTAQTGDVAVRSDLNKTFILKASPATTLANWIELRTPTNAVLSVNGSTGAVTITTITGNAGTASKLATARTINGVSFDGTANIAIEDTTRAPISHASTNTTYGISSVTNYGHTMASSATPLINGTAAVGTDNGKYAREAHVHPTDTTRAPLASPALTGSPTAPTAAATTNTTQIATTAYVKNQGYLDAGSIIDGGTF